MQILKKRPTARVTGGWRDETRSRNGKNPKPRKNQFGGENPAVRVHAVLGGFMERKTPCLEKGSTVKLMHL
jgi:hypothetical protein